MASAPAFALILLSLPFLAAAQSPAAAPTISPAPAPGGLPDPVAILTQAGKFSTLLKSLKDADLVGTLEEKVKSREGITVFAPTDDAFQKISSILQRLSTDNVTTILLYHALTKYVPLNKLDTLGNPVGTLKTGLTLNFTGGNVSTGVVNTKVGTPLQDEYPLGIFPIEDVLIPPTFASALAPTPSGSPALTPPASPTATPPVKSPSAPAPSAASLERVGWGALVGAALACLSFY